MSDEKSRLSYRLQSCFRFLVLLAAPLAAAPAAAQDAPALRWELVNPFRFIHDQKTVDELKSVYAEMGRKRSVSPAYDLERALQKRSDDEVDGRRAKARSDFNCDDPKATEDVKSRCFEPYAGWFARLAENNYSKTCWNPATRDFRTDVPACVDYIYPEYHYVRVWMENPQPPGGSPPTWLIDDQPLAGSRLKFKNCDARPFCVEIRVPYDAADPRKLTVSVRLSDGVTVTLPKPIEVVDRLVVGLGDSYAAGEGNPDRPARFTQGEKDWDFLPPLLARNIRDFIKGSKRPQKDRDADGAARWLDGRCHRSMYSYQFKTALLLALWNPQEAVTYVSYSCSGATTDGIIDKKSGAIEGRGEVDPQLDSLRKVLSKDGRITREVDYLLLSTGGNDIEFSKYVTYAVLTGAALWGFEHLRNKGVNEDRIIEASRAGKFKSVLLDFDGRFNSFLLDSDGSYARLHRALLDAPPKTGANSRRGAGTDESRRIRIKDCKSGDPCRRILLTPYPDILKDEDNKPCKAERKEFDYPFGEDGGRARREGRTRARRIETLSDYVFRQIRDVQQDPMISGQAGLGWTVVGSNVGAFAGHGFCAQTRRRPLPVEEDFEQPRWERAGGWTPFDPTKYRPYASRLRWVRLPIDAKLTTDQMHVILRRFNVDLFLEDDRSIIMHPTAEGLAATADENFKEIQKLAGAPQTNPPTGAETTRAKF